MADRVAVMAQGQVMQIGRPTEVYDRPRTRFVSEFLGTANIFTGSVKAREGAVWRVAIDPQGTADALVAAETLRPGQRVMLAVRPEKLLLGPPVASAIQAKVRDVVFRGAYFAYELNLPNQEQPLFAYTQTRDPVGEDGAVGLTWTPDSAVILEEPA